MKRLLVCVAMLAGCTDPNPLFIPETARPFYDFDAGGFDDDAGRAAVQDMTPTVDLASAPDMTPTSDLVSACVECDGAPTCSRHCCGLWPACETR